MLTPAQLRSSPKWKRARKIALRGASHCSICGRPLDFHAPARSKWAPSVDHVTPLVSGGAAFDLSNLRVCHYGCNARLGAPLGNRSAKRAVRRKRADWRRYVATGAPLRRDWW